ncbi:hypothetical protein phiA019_0114 [Aeromonas phage phiA019]|nr:hypothetical protein phiA009_0117 [Aeromonas phage phiA009]ULG01651.1 hypothetical protein phiA019_0114 [Aeromonas phage phiA019]
MRKSKGKWVASRRDVWDLDYTLSPIIFAGLVKFKETIINSKYSGVPSLFVKGEDVTDEDVKEWHDAIDKMIYAFDKNNMPDIQDYNFKINIEHGEKANGSTQIFLNCDNEEEKQRYYKDLEDHQKKCEEGRMLFAKYYENLWY